MGKALTKSQFLQAFADKLEVSKKEAQELVEKLVDLLYSEARNNGEVTLPGIGKLQKKDRKARMGRNPATGEEIHIPAKTVVKFRVAKAAKDNILG
jgi:DNA-binding protein HU-beta